VDQCLAGSVRERRQSQQVLAEIVCVGINGQQVNIDGKGQAIGDNKILLARGMSSAASFSTCSSMGYMVAGWSVK